MNIEEYMLDQKHWKHFWLVCTVRSAIDIIKYNTIQSSLFVCSHLHQTILI